MYKTLMAVNPKINNKIWDDKYRFVDEEVGVQESTPSESFLRVSKYISKGDAELEEACYEEMCALRLLLGGRMLAAAGTGRIKATMSNCYVLDAVPDDLEGIAEALKEAMLTMKAGGGIGVPFSRLRPEGSEVMGTGSAASGPISFMHMWDSMSTQISGFNGKRLKIKVKKKEDKFRKGAMIAGLSCDHPDIFKFIQAKKDNTRDHPVLSKFNISVAASDEFIEAVKRNVDWELKHDGLVYEVVKARAVWKAIIENAHQKAEPGILFISRINKTNNLHWLENIEITNPCGEQPLAPYDSCNLGSINLAMLVVNPFSEEAYFDFEQFEKTIAIAVRALDNAIDVNYYPLPAQRENAINKRKVGLGIMGLGSAIAMLRLPYGSEASLELIEQIMFIFRNTAYSTSVDLAAARGPFPLFDADKYLSGEFVKRLPDELKERIRRHGIRNANLTTIAPTGTIAQLAGNVSSGVEPIFCLEFIRTNYGTEVAVRDYAFELYCELNGKTPALNALPYFVTAHQLSVDEHLGVMALCQRYIDTSISKTINLPADVTVDEMADVYLKAYDMGCKGCTVYRAGSLDEEILKAKDALPKALTASKKIRPKSLPGEIIKMEIPNWKHAFYLAFSDYVIDGKNIPAELFVNTNDPYYAEFVEVIGKLVSEILRRTDDPSFVPDILTRIESRETGFYSGDRQKWVNSLTAEIGECLKDHFRNIGILEEEVPIEEYVRDAGNGNGNNNGLHWEHLGYCRKCGQHAVVFQEGCPRCLSCQDSRCTG